MCGIAGVFSSAPRSWGSDTAGRLLDGLRHRGPDDEGDYESPDGRALLVHTRLAILDLSAAGHQPMELAREKLKPGKPKAETGGAEIAESGRIWIVFNGEIYNFHELRRELEAEGRIFRTRTDTEVLLHLYERDGARCVERLRGMFAFAIWDEGAGRGLLARDPFGIKPLYYHEEGGGLVFASEQRALVRAGLVEAAVDPAAVRAFFRWGSVPEPLTMLRGVRVLPAGSVMEWSGGRGSIRSFWSAQIEPSSPVLARAEAVARTREALLDSVRAHWVSDAPVGVFLSGGIDSTALVALSRALGRSDLSTYSIGFEEAEFDEGTLAVRTAEHFGAHHRAWRLGAVEGRGLLEDFLSRLDRPSIDGFNTFCVSKLAREAGVKVVLSGLGADEVFGGYPSFRRAPALMRLHRTLSRVPGVRAVAAAGVSRLSRPQHRRLGEFLSGPGSVAHAYTACRALFTDVEAGALARWWVGEQTAVDDDDGLASPEAPTPEDAVSLLELSRYMGNQLLRDSDVMSMASGLELRVPFVDASLFDTLRSIPAAIRLEPGKRLLTQAVPEIPEWVLNQPKRGFMIPYQRWLDDDWREVIAGAVRDAPVPLTNWYQRWAVYVLKEWQERLLAMRTPAPAPAGM